MSINPIRKILTEPAQIYQAISRRSLKNCPYQNCATCPNDLLCTKECKNEAFCLSCLSDIFNNSNSKNRAYTCENITFSYVLRFLNRYASEVFHILNNNIKFINREETNVLSIGCGPATELIGFEKYIHTNKDIKINFWGYDMNPVWTSCHKFFPDIFRYRNNVNVFFQTQFLNENNPIVKEINFLFLNYLISDIYKHAKTNPSKEVMDYLTKVITPIFLKMPSESYVIINDTNSCYMGRNEIETWINSVNSSALSVKKGVFDYPGRYNYANFNAGGKVESNNTLIFPAPNSAFVNYDKYTINVNECRSAYVVLQRR